MKKDSLYLTERQHQANRLSKSSSAKTEEELKEITLSDLKATI